MTPDFISELGFEAGFLCAPVWRLNQPEQADKAVAAAKSARVGLISCRLSEGDAGASKLEEAGFRLIETLVSLRARCMKAEMPAQVRLSDRSQQDADACAAIGETAFVYDRFHADPLLPDQVGDAIKREWVRNSVLGRADCVLIYETRDGAIAGFNACMIRGDDAVIDLIGVAPGHQGQGIGSALLRAMHAHYAGKQPHLSLGTQEANSQSLGFYAKHGFEEFKREQTWHWVPEKS